MSSEPSNIDRAIEEAKGTPDIMRVAQGKFHDGLLYDITEPLPGFEVVINVSGRTLWVNVGPACVLRICRMGEVKIRRDGETL